MAGNGTIKYNVDFSVNKNSLNQLKSELQSVKTIAQQALSGVNTSSLNLADQELKEIITSANQLEGALDRAFNTNLGTLNVSKFNQELQKLNLNKIQADFAKAGAAGQNAFRNMTTQVLTTNMQLKQTHSLIDNMATTMANTVKWGIASSIMNNFTGSVQKAYGYVKKLDTSLNNIMLVTDKSAENMESFAKQANKAAKELGASTTAYTDAALIYYQQGLSDEEVAARAETTLKAANVTQQSAEEVSEQLTAVWNGYKVNAQEAELYVDKLAAVAATTAADLEELSTGMSKVASAANSMGVDVDQLNAQLATIVSVTRQAPESVGTALKTIYARMGDLSIDGEDEFGVSLGEVSGKMEQMGIQITDQQGNLRDMGIVIEETAAKWDTWTEAQKQAAAVAMAGKRQYNNLIALFENWDMYEDALNTSANSVGFLQEQQDEYMESMAAHLQELSTATESLYSSLINADSMNDLIDGLTIVVQLVDNFVQSIGGGGNLLLSLGAIGTRVFSKQIASGLATTVMNLRASKENAAQLAAEMEMVGKFSNLQKDDSRYQRIIEMKKQELEYSKIITAEEREISNEYIRQTNELFKQQDSLAARKQNAEQMHAQMYKDNSLELTTGTAQEMSQDFARDIDDFEDYQKGTAKLTEAEKEYYTTLLNGTHTTEDMERVTGNYLNTANKQYTQALKLISTNKLSNKQIMKLSDAMSQYEKVSKNAGKTDTLTADTKIAGNKLHKTYSEILQEVILKLKKVKNTTDNYEHELDELNNKLLNGKIAWEGFTSSISLKNMINNTVQAVGAVGQLAMSINYLTSMVDIFKNEELSFGEKTLQFIQNLSFMLPMIISGFSGLAGAMAKTAAGQGYLAAAEAARIPILIAQIQAGKLSNITEAERAEILKVLTLAQKGETLTEEQAILVKNLLSTANLGLAGTLKVASAAMKGFFASMGPIGWIIIAIGIIGGLVAAFGDIETAEEKAIRKHEESKRALEAASAAAQEATSQYDDLKTSLDEIGTAEDTISNLAKGTLEWKEAVLKLNQQVLTLLQTYPELSKWITSDENGILSIQEEGIDYILNQQLEETQRASSSLVAATMGETITSKQKERTKIAKSFGEDDAFWDSQTDYYNNTHVDVAYPGFIDYLTDDLIMNRIDISTLLKSTKNGQLNAETFAKYYKGINPSSEISTADVQNLFSALNGDTSLMLDTARAFDLTYTYIEKDKDGNPTGVTEERIDEASVEYLKKILLQLTDMGVRYEESQNKEKQVIKNSQYQDYASYTSLDNTYANLTDEEKQIISSTAVNSSLYQDAYEEGINIVNSELEKGNSKNDEGRIAKLMQEMGYEVNEEDIEDEGSSFTVTIDGQEYDWTNEKLRQEYGLFKAREKTTGEEGYQDVIDNYKKIIGDKDHALYQSGALSQGKVDLSKLSMEEIDSLYENQKSVKTNDKIAKLFGFDNKEELNQAISDALQPDKMAEMWNTKAEEFASKVEKTGSLLETAYSGEEWSDEQEQSLKALGQEYEILNKIKDKGSRAYIEALEEIQELEEENLITAKTKALKFAADAIKDEDSETEGIQVNLNQDDLTEVGDQIQALFDTTYELDIAITDEIISDVENIINRAEGLQTAVASIGEGFKVAAEDSEELFKVFPELAEGAEILANGTIQLDKQVVDSVLGGQAEIIDGDKNVVRQKIQNRIKELDIEIDTIDAQLEAVKDGTLEKSELTDILTELQNQNSENVTNTEGENIKTQVSNDAQGTTAIIDNWSAKEDAAIAYAKTARKAIRSIFTGEKVDKAITSDSYGKVVSTVETKEGTTVEDTDKMTQEELAELVETNLVNRKQSLINQRAELVKWGASMYDETTTKIQEADEDNDKQLDFLEDEKDIYHDINIEIQQLENSMEELQETQEKLYGQDLLVNLQQQLNLLERQEDAQRRKLAIAQQEAATLKSTLAGQGTTFNEDGTIANYQALYDQKLAYVNSVIASGDEDTADAAQEAFEEWVSNVERYDELLTGELPEIDQMLRDIANQRIEKQIEAFEYEIQLKLDIKDAERDWNDFKRNMTIDEDDILGNTRFSLDSFKSYLGDDGTITTLLDKNRELMDQYNQIQTTGTSSIYGDNMAALMEDMQENQEELMSAMEEQKDLLDEIEEAYVNMLDAAQEAFDEQIAQYEAINEIYSHGLNVINVLYGEDAYADMEGFYQKQMDNNNQMIDMQRRNVEFYKKQLEDTTLTDEQREEVQRKLQEAQAALHSSVESQIDLIINKYTNAINKIFQELENKMTGGKGLSYIQEEWDLLNQNAEMYLDQINSAYEVEKLAREYNKAIDATDSLSAQRKLNELMEQQLKGLREKEKLTQYDVDRANALLDVELKRIALEEAQQNKSKMRLRRDASGNYSYQFVSDEEATAEAQQELADAQNSLYNLDKDALQENQEAALNMWTEFKDKYIEIMSDVTLSDEEREARLQLIREQYGEMYNNLLMQNENIRKNLEASALDEMKELNLDYVLGENGLVPTWDSGVQQMMDKFAGEGGLLPTCSEAFGELSNLTAQYDADLATLEANAGYSLGNIAGYTEEVATQMESVLADNDELIAKYEEELRQLGELRSEVSSLMGDYNALTTAATAAANAILNTRKVEADIEAEKAAQEAAEKEAAEQAAKTQTDGAAQQLAAPSLAGGSSVTVKTTATHFSRDGGNGTRMKSFVPGGTYSVMQVSGNEVLIGRGGVATGWVNKTDLVGFNTGGYTGDWADNSGRLAFLHKKELILNEKDTKNILQAVDLVRSIDGIMESIMGKAFDRVNAQLNGLNSMNIPVSSTASDSTIEQHIEINADFPGVEKASEIISAFENLTNMATQYAFKTDR